VPDSVAAVLLAAGSSQRMAGTDKLWSEVAGQPLVAYSLRTLASLDAVGLLVVVAPAARHQALRDLVPGGVRVEVRCVEGGARRQDSVAAGIAAVPDADWYLVHDAARPLVTSELCERVLAAARLHRAATAGVPITDTVKRVDEVGRVRETLDRGPLRASQTPQAFAGALLRRAHVEVASEVTDDAAMIEALGEPVFLVPGLARNFKVTTQADLDLVRALVGLGRI
jgi:2-C-methyl-D-erythritol 4-phosphate cytidylyltransferase